MSKTVRRSSERQREVTELRRSNAAQPHRNKKAYVRNNDWKRHV